MTQQIHTYASAGRDRPPLRWPPGWPPGLSAASARPRGRRPAIRHRYPAPAHQASAECSAGRCRTQVAGARAPARRWALPPECWPPAGYPAGGQRRRAQHVTDHDGGSRPRPRKAEADGQEPQREIRDREVHAQPQGELAERPAMPLTRRHRLHRAALHRQRTAAVPSPAGHDDPPEGRTPNRRFGSPVPRRGPASRPPPRRALRLVRCPRIFAGLPTAGLPTAGLPAGADQAWRFPPAR